MCAARETARSGAAHHSLWKRWVAAALHLMLLVLFFRGRWPQHALWFVACWTLLINDTGGSMPCCLASCCWTCLRKRCVTACCALSIWLLAFACNFKLVHRVQMRQVGATGCAHNEPAASPSPGTPLNGALRAALCRGALCVCVVFRVDCLLCRCTRLPSWTSAWPTQVSLT